jgi:hypothetical protein
MRKILKEYIEYWLRFYDVPGEKWDLIMKQVDGLVDEFDKAVAPEVQKSWKEMRHPLNSKD